MAFKACSQPVGGSGWSFLKRCRSARVGSARLSWTVSNRTFRSASAVAADESREGKRNPETPS
eukprot:10073191-Ditylum_brightwellii.AAC.1